MDRAGIRAWRQIYITLNPYYLCGVEEIIARISAGLTGPLPGWEAQQRMINYPRPASFDLEAIAAGARKGAVLSLLYPRESRLHTVLILRNVYVGTHSGQVSFPGGKREEKDASLWDTAIREAEEEIGVSAKDIQFLGQLTDVYIPPSRFLVTPFLGFVDYAPDFIADPREVQRIIESPLSEFLLPEKQNEKSLFVEALGSSMNVKYFDIAGETIWGATAMMLSEIAEICRRSKADEIL
jgi:8-oxo-dGTP pyrophosphatase MutT (NUDIX family)